VHAGVRWHSGYLILKRDGRRVVLIAEVNSEDEVRQQQIADKLREHVTVNSAIALRYVKVVDPEMDLENLERGRPLVQQIKKNS